MKMQIAFRMNGSLFHGKETHLAVGVIELPVSTALEFEEKFVPFSLRFNERNSRIEYVYQAHVPLPITSDYGSLSEFELDAISLENLATMNLNRTVPNDIVNAEFAFRRTEVTPTDPDKVVLAFSGFVYLEPGSDADLTKSYQLEGSDMLPAVAASYSGTIGEDVFSEIGPLDVEQVMAGKALTAYLREAWWGFGDEPVSLPGAMRTDMYRRMTRHMDLFFDRSSPEEEAEFQALEKELARHGLNTISKNEEFADYMGELRRRVPGHLLSQVPHTLSEMNERHLQSQASIAAIFASKPL